MTNPALPQSSKYTLTSQTTLKTRTPILSLQLAPSLSKALVLSDDTLSFLSLPRLDPVPSDVIRSMKNALGFAVNETPLPLEPVGLAIVKRTAISFWEVGNKAHFVRVSPSFIYRDAFYN
jgi:vacuolar protein sorting-associated protein 3